MSETSPGRACPLHYRTRPEDLAGGPDLHAETAYVIGGLYGNPAALEAIKALAAVEVAQGLPRPRRIFNGDFHWFDAESELFAGIQKRVLAHTAMQGNVEAELADPDPGAGCGCAYPEWVDDNMVARSNRIMESVQQLIGRQPSLSEQLGRLPRQLRLEIAGHRIGVVHGDPDSIAGWGLAVEQMPPPGTSDETLENWFRAAEVDAIACTHTCLPFIQDCQAGGRRRVVINNGSAGMPNFRDDPRGLISRISRHPAPFETCYRTRLGSLYLEAVPLEVVTREWRQGFERMWPPGSPAYESYWSRLMEGPDFTRARAVRLAE